MTELNKETFETTVRQAAGTVLVDFWAPWCGPCKMLGPIVAELASDLGDQITIAKVDIDENPALATEFGVMTIPTLILFSGGKEVERKSGLMPKAALMSWLEPHI